MATKPATVDEYLAKLPADQRKVLASLRATIRAVVPRAEERISYGICVFHLDRLLVGFGARQDRCAFYLLSNRTLSDYADAVKGYDTSTGTIRFLASEPLPRALVRRLVKARLAENLESMPRPRRATSSAARRRSRRV